MEPDEKKFLKSVKRQLEFYFSDGNLPKDKFMNQCIQKSEYNSVLINDLLKFNKLIELNVTEKIIIDAVKKSKFLVLDESGKGIKRNSELSNLKPPDSRTIFICGFLCNDDNENLDLIYKKLKTLFKKFGDILRIDLPKYNSTKKLRGFGFIEFKTKTSCRCALKEYKPESIEDRKLLTLNYFSFMNKQYSQSLKQLNLLTGNKELTFVEKIKGNDKKNELNKLIAISKKEWLKFRSEFYEKQKDHLNEIRNKINEFQTKSEKMLACSHKKHERVTVEENVQIKCTDDISIKEYCGNIGHFKINEDNCTKKQIKIMLNDYTKSVQYIDFRDFELEGFLRFSSNIEAKNFIDDASTKVCGFKEIKILNESQEADYEKRIEDDKVNRRINQKRKIERKRKKDVEH